MAIDFETWKKKREEDNTSSASQFERWKAWKSSGDKSPSFASYEKKQGMLQGGKQPEDEAYSAWLDALNSYADRTSADYRSRENQYQRKTDLGRYNIDQNAHIAQLRTGAEQSRNYYEQNRELYDELYGTGTVDSILASLSSGTKYLDDIIKGIRGEYDYWNQWDSEDAYSTYLEQQAEYERLSSYDLPTAQTEITALQQQLEEVSAQRGRAQQQYSSYSRGRSPNAAEAHQQYEELSTQQQGIEEQLSGLQRAYSAAESVQNGNEYNAYLESADFRQYSALGEDIENTSAWDTQKGVEIFGWNPFAETVKNKVKFAKENYEQLAIGAANGSASDEIGYLPYYYMTDEEAGIYNYLLAKEGEQAADEYLKHMTEALNYRMGTQQAANIEDIDSGVLRGGAKALYGVGAGLEQFASGTRQMFSKDALPTSPVQYGSAAIRESLSDDWAQLPDWMGGSTLAQAAYDAITTTANMAPSILLSYVTAGLGAPAAVATGVGSAALGASAGGNAYKQARDEGYGEIEARNYAVLIGASEAGLQYALGGINALGGKALGKTAIGRTLQTSIKNIDSSLLRVAANIGVNMFKEGSEEYLQDILEPAFRNMMLGESNEIKIWTPEATYSFLLGAITAGLMEGGEVISADRSGAAVIKSGHYDTLLSNALSLEQNSEAFSLATQLSDGTLNANSTNVGELLSAYTKAGGDLSFIQQPSESVKATIQEETAETDPRYQAGVAVDDAIRDAAYEAAVEPSADTNNDVEDITSRQVDAAHSPIQQQGNVSELGGAEVQNTSAKQVATASKAINVTSGEPVIISGISSVESGVVTAQDSNGNAIPIDEIEFDDVNISNLYDKASVFDTNSAKAFVSSYDGSVPVGEYYLAFASIYGAARNGAKSIDVAVGNSLYAKNISMSAQASAFYAGQNAGKISKAKVPTPAAHIKESGENGHTDIDGTGNIEYRPDNTKSGGVKLLNTVKLTKAQESQANALDVVFKVVGRTVELVDSIDFTDESGNIVRKSFSNAQFDPDTNTYRIAVDGIGEAYMYFAAHESIHDIKINNPAGYAKLEGIVFDFLNVNGEDVDALIETQKELGYNESQAREEVVANSVPAILTDLETGNLFAERFLSEDAETKSIFSKILDSILDFLHQAYDALSKQKSWKQMRSLEQDIAAITEIRAAYFDALEGLKKQTEKEQTSTVRRSIKYDIHNTPFVVADNDILAGVSRGKWINTVKSNLSTKFPDGVVVGGNKIAINEKSRREMTFSKYTQWLMNNEPDVFADKLRATNNAGEILKASRNYVNEALLHPRKDTIQQFARGDVLLRIGNNDYSAKVVVGLTKGNKMLLYDILDIQTANISERSSKKDAAISQRESEADRSATSNNKVPQSDTSVNGSIRKNSELDSVEPKTMKYSLVDDSETLDFLNNQESVTVYRAMQLIDGNLYPPMAARVKGGNGKKELVSHSTIGKWEQAEERPELIRSGNKYELDKANGSSIEAAYNPYYHASRSMLNDQFSSAYKRGNLVVVEGVIPKSELTSGYRAEHAKDAVGEMPWHSGPVSSKLKGDKARKVILSRWFKPVRVIPNAEVAASVADMLNGEHISVPANVVTPALAKELAAHGVIIKEYGHNTAVSDKQAARFSMKDGIEETDALIAIHNLSGEQLEGVLELGGFPMPSIAVIRATQGHDRYGDVSVIFDKETIDPQSSRSNKVYSGDAYTPNFPAVDYKPNDKAISRINKKYYELAREYGYEKMRPLYNFADSDNARDELSRYRGENGVIASFADDTAMMNVYLADSGKGMVDAITIEVRNELPPSEVKHTILRFAGSAIRR